MNLTQKLLIAAGCCIIAFSACKKDNPSPDNYISYKLNGVYKTIKPEANSFDDGTFLLDAGPFMKDEISLFIGNTVRATTYDLADTNYVAACDYYDQSGKHFLSDSGRLVIRSFDGEHISGSFFFRARALDRPTATINVTEGQFSAEVSYISSGVDTCETCDSMYAVKTRLKLMQRFFGRKQLAPGAPIKNN